MKIINAIIKNPQESRKHWMLDLFEKNGQRIKSNLRPSYRDQFWQHENHPILLNTKKMYDQRLVYFMKIRKEQGL